jgi:hypothetical protein
VQEYTLRLPGTVIEMLRRAASERHESPDDVAAEALRFALDPVRQEALLRLKANARRLRGLLETEMRERLDAQLTAKERTRLSHLLETEPNARLDGGRAG